MQRIFLTQEGYPYLCQIPLAQRGLFSAPLLKLLNAGQPSVAGLEAFSCGDVKTFLLNLNGEYQALVRQLDHPDEGAGWIILAIAPKADIRERASYLRIAWDGETATVVRVAPDGSAFDGSRPFLSFTSLELQALGVPEALITKIRACADEEDLRDLEGDLPPRCFFQLLEVAERSAQLANDELTILSSKIADKELRGVESEVAQALDDDFHADRFSLFETEAQIQRLCQEELPAWVLFPQPDQKKWATRNLKGTLLLRGVSGAGKSSLAIHRARYLAEEILGNSSEKILLTTPIRYNAKFLQEDLQTLTGKNSPILERIEVNHVFGWATSYLQSLSMEAEVNSTLALEMLKEAIDACRQGMPNITPFHLDFNFVREEISAVIKGRALYGQPDYLALPRKNFGSPLTAEERRQMWRIYLKYQGLLEAKKVLDSDDLLVNTYRNLKKSPPKKPYAAIIIDDAQDLSPVALKIFHQLVKDRPNGLFLLSDITQKQTRTGESLGALGIDLAVRPPLLRNNLRNTREISEVGMAMLGNTRFEELDGSAPAPAITPETARRGLMPVVQSHESEEQEILWIIEQIQELTGESYGYKFGDVVLVARSNRYQTLLEVNLTQAQIPCVSFKKAGHDRVTNAVKICGYTDCVGMEFPVAILTEVTEGLLPKVPTGIDADELAAHLSREQRLLFSGMAQAKEVLYLSSYGAELSRFVAPLASGSLATAAASGSSDGESE